MQQSIYRGKAHAIKTGVLIARLDALASIMILAARDIEIINHTLENSVALALPSATASPMASMLAMHKHLSMAVGILDSIVKYATSGAYGERDDGCAAMGAQGVIITWLEGIDSQIAWFQSRGADYGYDIRSLTDIRDLVWHAICDLNMTDFIVVRMRGTVADWDDRDERAPHAGLYPGVAGIAGNAEALCLACARNQIGDRIVDDLVHGRMHHDYPDREGNPYTVILCSEEWEDPGPCCGECATLLDVSLVTLS